jgi:dTDP-4-amino-4,6-dideoxygalactose transaminase
VGSAASTKTAIPLVDLKAQYKTLKPEIERAFAEILEEQFFILGPRVERFEREFAAYMGVKHCVALQSGTAAVWLMLLAAGIKPGDEVITTPLTFFATVEGIMLCGAVPVFVDVDPKTLNIDPAKVEAAITPKTRALLPVNLYGQPVDLAALAAIAKKRGLMLFEDAAQSAGSQYKGSKSAGLSLAAATSFYPGKNLGAYGDAGAVYTDDAALADQLRLLRNHGSQVKNRHPILGLNARLESFQGAVLSVKLPRLDGWNASRRVHAAKYREALAGTPGLSFVDELPDCRSNYHLFVVRHAQRDELLTSLRAEGIEADIHYPIPAHLQPACGAARRPEGSFPVAEKAMKEIVSLPMFPELSAAQVERVVAAVRAFCGR